MPHASVKYFLLSKDISEKRAGWITGVMEYDVDIQITKLVRGRGLCKEMLSGQDSDEEAAMVLREQQEEGSVNGPKSWINNMKSFLSGNGYP